MWYFAEVFRLFRNRGSPVLQEKATLIERKIFPFHESYRFFRLVKVRWVGSFGKNFPVGLTMIGKWLESRVVRVSQFESKAMWEEAIVRSGEVGSLREWKRVGESRSRRLEFLRGSVMRVPLTFSRVLVV